MAARKKSTKRSTSRKQAESPHADFYRQLREKLQAWAAKNEIDEKYRDYLLLVPDLFHFLCRLVMDPRVATKDKALLGFALAYVISPIDLLPELFLGPFGLVDDLIVMVIVLDSVLKRTPRAVVNEHWAGKADLFDVIRDSLVQADEWVGKGMFRKIKRFLAKQGFWPEAAVSEAVKTAKKAANEAMKNAKEAANKVREAVGGPRKKTPSRRPGQAGAKKATKKTAAKKTGAKKTTQKAAAKKKSTKKAPARRTIAAKTPKKKATRKSSPKNKA